MCEKVLLQPFIEFTRQHFIELVCGLEQKNTANFFEGCFDRGEQQKADKKSAAKAEVEEKGVRKLAKNSSRNDKEHIEIAGVS